MADGSPQEHRKGQSCPPQKGFVMSRSENAIAAVIGLLSIPVMLLNFGGEIIGGIWLAILGNWGLLVLGLSSIFISSFGISFALMPGLLLFSAPGVFAMEKGRYVIGLLAALLGNLWTDAVMTVWCVGCFVVALGYYSDGSVWPYLLWAYGMATGPWTYMAAREGQDAVGSTLAAFGACMGVIGIMGVILFASHPSIIDITIAFCIPISVVLILQVGMAIALVKSKDTFLSPA